MTSVTLMISSGNGPDECRQAVGHVLDRMTREAEAQGIEMDVAATDGKGGPSSAVVILSGASAAALAQAWEGVVLWRCASSLRPRHRRKNWFVQVFALPSAKAALQINPQEVDMQAIRAGGPGGQHQNKTSSAIRARWRSPAGKEYQVVVRDHRSQHQNRRIAIERLEAILAQEQQAAEQQADAVARHLHHELQRGNPSRVFLGPKFKE